MEEREIELIDYINVILKRKGLILIGTLICVVSAALYGYVKKAPTFYEASASLLVTPPPFKAELTPPSFPASVYEKLARAQDLEQAVIDSLGLKVDISGLDGMLTVELLKDAASPLITFSVKSDRPDLSIRIVNAWADLFVKRNSGITQRTVASSYDFIINQYDTAKKRLEDTEDAILRFKANNSQVAQANERTAEAAKLSEVQTVYTNQRIDLRAKEDSLKQQTNLLTAMEVDGRWVGALVEEGKRVPFDGLTEEQKSIRKTIADAARELLQAEKEVLAFQSEHRVDLLKAEVDKKTQTLAAYQAELVTINLGRKATQVALEQADKQLQTQSPGLVLSKAITDDALWQRMRDGALSPDDLKKLEALKLRSEEINPVYVDLLKRKSELQLEYNSYTPREVVLKEEIEKLKKELPSLQERLQGEERKQTALARRTIIARAVLNAFVERYSAIKARTEQLRLEITALKDNLAYIQSALESSKSRVLNLDDQIGLSQLDQARLDRDVGIYKSTFDRFAKLVEDARIAKAGEVSDLKVVMRAVEATVLPPKGTNTIMLAGAVGLMASAFLAFFIEYVEKAHQRSNG